MRTFKFAGLLILLSGAAFGQKFDVAEIHAAAPSPYQSVGPVLYKGGRYEFRAATLQNLITNAYGVDPDKVVDGPSWLAFDRFDIIAKTSPDATLANLNAMLKTLLEDRFGLTLHNDKRPMPTYALVVGDKPEGDKPQMQKATGSGPGGCKALAAGGRGGTPRFTDINGSPTELGPGAMIFYECRNITMPAFVELLRKMSMQDFGNPLVDQTGLQGAWDFDLTYSMMRGGDMSTIRTIFVAIEHLGLKLQPAKAPMPVVVVDHANRTPTTNPLNAAELLPVRSTEYESVQMSPTDAPVNMGGLRGPGPNGRVDLRGSALKFLIANAWSLGPDQVVGGPEFLTMVYPEIVAQAPVTNTPGLRQALDVETNRLMLQKLLADRFKLTTHEEQYPMDVYVISADAPKLRKADPSSRTGCTNYSADGTELKGFSMTTERHIACLNMTVAQFVDYIPSIAANMFMNMPRTVVNETGIDGAFDFNFVFTGFGAPPGRPAPGGPQPSLQEILAAKFGLKVEIAKRSQPVIVVDHVEAKPTEK